VTSIVLGVQISFPAPAAPRTYLNPFFGMVGVRAGYGVAGVGVYLPFAVGWCVVSCADADGEIGL
jgi:hypothetical protein